MMFATFKNTDPNMKKRARVGLIKKKNPAHFHSEHLGKIITKTQRMHPANTSISCSHVQTDTIPQRNAVLPARMIFTSTEGNAEWWRYSRDGAAEQLCREGSAVESQNAEGGPSLVEEASMHLQCKEDALGMNPRAQHGSQEWTLE